MSRRGGEEAAWLIGAAPPPRWVRLLPPALLVVLTVLQTLTPATVELGFLLASTSPLAALSYGPVATALFGGAVLLLLMLPGMHWVHPGNDDMATVVFVALLSVLLAWVRSRRDAQLISVSSVAEAAQLAVLPPLPERVGRVRCAGLYRAAQLGTLVGGDLYDVRQGPCGVRAVVADVQGHGLAAVGTVAALLGAFREAVLDERDLDGVAARLDRRLVVDSADDEHAELFATALLLEFPPDRPEVRVLCCGHPPPLLLRGGTAVELPVEAGPPLGLGLGLDLGRGLDPGREEGYVPTKILTVPLEPGDRLLAHTDGVTEARDASGAYYPLRRRLDAMSAEEREAAPARLADAVLRDVRRFAGDVRDDVALLVLDPVTPPCA